MVRATLYVSYRSQLADPFRLGFFCCTMIAQNSGKRKHTATNNVTQRAATWNDDREQEGEMCAAKKRKPNPKDEQTPLMPNIGATKFQIKIPRAVSWAP